MEGGALGPAVADGSGGERVLVAHPIRTGSGAGGIPQERRQVCVRADSRVGQMLAGSGAGSAGAGSGERGKWSNHLKCAVRLAALPPQRASPHRDKSSRGAAISPCGSSPCGIGRFGSSPLGSSPLRSSPRGAGVGVVRPKWNASANGGGGKVGADEDLAANAAERPPREDVLPKPPQFRRRAVASVGLRRGRLALVRMQPRRLAADVRAEEAAAARRLGLRRRRHVAPEDRCKLDTSLFWQLLPWVVVGSLCLLSAAMTAVLTAQINEPVGVIAMLCPTEFPLLGLVSLIAPAVVRGNAVVVVPSEKHPLCATDLYQVLETSDLPAGVINIVTGQRDHLAKTLADHQDVDSIWYFGSAEGSYHVEHLSAKNMKRTLVDYGEERDWYDREQGEGHDFLHEATQVKNIWVPMGA